MQHASQPGLAALPPIASAGGYRPLARLVDLGLIGVMMLIPWIMGGRHPLGELALVGLAVLTAGAWLVDRAWLGRTTLWTHSPAEWLLLLAIALVVLQLTPLPMAVLHILSPHTSEILPLWSDHPTLGTSLGTWDQVTMTPTDTRAGLTLLISYGLLFLVAVQRLQRLEDVEWLLRWLVVSVAVQAAFGIVQYLTANGKFVWIYQHPYRDTFSAVMGAYINKNHFAHLMALGLGPLVCLTAAAIRRRGRPRDGFGHSPGSRQWQAILAVLALSCVLFAGLMTLSRGGAAAMFLATTVAVAVLWRVGLVQRRFVGALAAVFLLMTAALVIHGYSRVAERLDDYRSVSVQQLDQAHARRDIWQADFKALGDYFVCGSGVGSHREIYPLYLSEPWPTEFTHAENGYLQVALEAGLPGLGLLLAGLGWCAVWCWRSLRNTTSPGVVAAAGVAAGLLASAAHSLVDFVWYIPSCMAITVLLAACAFRLAQWSQKSNSAQPIAGRPLAPAFLWGAAALLAVVGGWMIADRFRASMAETYWDRFTMLQLAMRDPHQAPDSDEVVAALEGVLDWTPDNARAHLRLASVLLSRFERLQAAGENVMPLCQVRDAAFASRNQFATLDALEQWLARAIGDKCRYLDSALWHVHRGLALCPLQGDGYVWLSQLCFLEGATAAEKSAYVAQALDVRPYDGAVLLAAGSEAAFSQDFERMLACWRPVLKCGLAEKETLVNLFLSTRLPLEFFLDSFQPNLDVVRLMVAKCAAVAPPQAFRPLLLYYVRLGETEAAHLDGESAASIWFELHNVYQGLNEPGRMLDCLRRAAVGRPGDYEIRSALGRQLCQRGAFAEAIQHLNWCRQRRPGDAAVAQALATAVKARVDQQTRTAVLTADGR